jgi:hypothetical protein
MARVSRPPSIDALSFDCPNCDAFAHQTWFNGAMVRISSKERVPNTWTHSGRETLNADTNVDDATKHRLLTYIDKLLLGKPFTSPSEHSGHTPVNNVYFSECSSCNEFAVWIGHRQVYPPVLEAVAPNSDMPADIAADFEEARGIVDASPRGAAALLRLVVQKLCAELGESGKNIDDDIASLVRKGLNPTIQKSLDIVRVIGNEAVHPGTIDLRDDRRTAVALFQLVNGIVDQMITHPKAVDAMYASLPAGKLKGIERRDK